VLERKQRDLRLRVSMGCSRCESTCQLALFTEMAGDDKLRRVERPFKGLGLGSRSGAGCRGQDRARLRWRLNKFDVLADAVEVYDVEYAVASGVSKKLDLSANGRSFPALSRNRSSPASDAVKAARAKLQRATDRGRNGTKRDGEWLLGC
jgi:hypothetical protein